MCGVAGIAQVAPTGVPLEQLARMAAAIHHRGPDGYGYFTSSRVGLAHLRLSIIDLAGGAQPMASEDGQVVISYNGEVYNYRELAAELKAMGHRFRTVSDTEVLLVAYEAWGTDMLPRLNGQFAFAIWDGRKRQLLLVRDRFGVRPMFLAQSGGDLCFASEVKALFASGRVTPRPDPEGLDEIFTFWGARPPRTPFLGVEALEPGSYAIWQDGRLRRQRYYHLDYPEARLEPADAIARLDHLMRTGVDLRMRADVPVGGYLSGGLDSSITCSLAAAASPHQLRTFSISFDDPRFDESEFQRQVARSVGSLHAVERISGHSIAASFPDAVRHTETPLVRTAPVPMYLLAKLTRERGIKVVLTGEGADELFLGYDLFKEVLVRRFCLRQPGSKWRPRLFDRLYPYLAEGSKGGEFWQRSFLDAGRPDDPLFSHMPRILLTSRIKEFYTPEFAGEAARGEPLQKLRDELPARFQEWSPVNQAAYLEMVTLLSPYLLCSQGDRVGMAHAVEGRFPFLDHRLYEFASALPVGSRLHGLKEKYILKRWASTLIPREVTERHKQPYRAPDAPSFFAPDAPAYVAEMLDPATVKALGYFNPAGIEGLVRRCRSGRALGFRENQALVAVLSTHVWHTTFMRQPSVVPALDPAGADVLLREPAPVDTQPLAG
ncbi:MAG TPA: asparagine synthase (glutamine-hydrolyzing) [Gemmatimonadales bacterium]|nr:asparagine synthase (glutamine-hydrolyzing) [Gemmatimonadales bacterium]